MCNQLQRAPATDCWGNLMCGSAAHVQTTSCRLSMPPAPAYKKGKDGRPNTICIPYRIHQRVLSLFSFLNDPGTLVTWNRQLHPAPTHDRHSSVLACPSVAYVCRLRKGSTPFKTYLWRTLEGQSQPYRPVVCVLVETGHNKIINHCALSGHDVIGENVWHSNHDTNLNTN
jgi:hypothetical protein